MDYKLKKRGGRNCVPLDVSLDEFEEILICAIEKAGSRAALCRDLNMSTVTLLNWRTGKFIPSIEKLNSLRNYLKETT
jgi:ribosome-binding protein aMBF1 (putative translation factor)